MQLRAAVRNWWSPLLSEALSAGLLRDGCDGSTGVGGVEFSLDGFKINPGRASLTNAIVFLESGLGGTETEAWLLVVRLWGGEVEI